MSHFAEHHLEQAVMEWFRELGYQTIYGPDISPGGSFAERENFGDVVLYSRLHSALKRVNRKYPDKVIDDLVKKITSHQSMSISQNNTAFFKMITDGIDVEIRNKDGNIKTEKAYIFDLTDIENNEFLAVNQYTIIENGKERRPDVVVFINGLPLAVIELKNTSNEDIGILEGFNQLQTYKKDIPTIFYHNAFLVTSDGINAKVGTISSDFDRFMFWRTVDGTGEAPVSTPQLKVMLHGIMDKKRILDIVSNYTFFVHEDDKTFKILAGYHQYFAVKKALYKTHIATAENGDRKVGVIWHTQGSGKSFSMLMYTRQLVLELNNPTIVIITDRNDLDDQLFGTFAKSADYLRQFPRKAENRKQLRDLLSIESGGIIFTTIQKFSPDESDQSIEALTNRRNVIVIADEAHRSQYGLEAKEKDGRVSFGFAKYMRDALPSASFIGFTGTPVELSDKSTPALFGDYIDIYDLTQAVKDKTTVPIYYESRIAKLDIPQEIKPRIDIEYAEIVKEQEETYIISQQRKWARLEALVGTDTRLDVVAKDFLHHYDLRQNALSGKVMFVAMSRNIAVKLYSTIIKYRPEWHNDEVDKGTIKVIMTSAASDPQEFQMHSTTSAQKKLLAKRMKDPDDELNVVIVCDMWLTGFDVPCLHTMYIDKPMSGHNLMQAIARVNRVFKDKPGGLVVDYIGIADNLRSALAQYTPSDRKTTGIDPQIAIDVMIEKYEQIKGLLHGFDYSSYLYGTASQRMDCIVKGVDFVLGKAEDERKDFLNFVVEIGKAYALCSTSEKAQKINLDISFFKAVKAGIIKLLPKDKPKKTKDQIEYEIGQLVSKSVISEEIVDILAAVGLNKPDISILSDDFLEEVKGLPQKNLALELLRRLLDGKIKAISKNNIVQAKKFSEMLEASVNHYTKRSLETAEVIKALVDMAKDLNNLHKRGEELGLSDDELAFYDAISENESARKFYKNDVLKQIAKELAISIRNNMRVDWDVRESVRAQMRITVKRLLRKYKYPPDNQTDAVKLIIEQAEKICEKEMQ
ncbi:type I restriction endonuclease subunit R [Heliophilum fasciatum]|uniref:Type I restriction enzyme endonuclease subunit n=1 Tax=Heliophilum fasciatum TaxID=35700 RepID=A0A4R2RBY2_9FIRM|nr:type I restriction endonuclease subunit R [Heliophilum fasciatum]MCW2279445.1 type I restriction enzyme R subunit [Heliophilum fasciatum]TCP59884.1 type I restriction enzyme R subunit [Heliophilum fasciatum]